MNGGRERICRVCRRAPARSFMNAWLCADHAPAFPVPDPSRTAAALAERRGRHLRALHRKATAA